MWRLGVTAHSAPEVVRMRRFSSIVVSGGVPRTWLTAVEMGPPLVTTSTVWPARWARTWSSAPVTPATARGRGGPPAGDAQQRLAGVVGAHMVERAGHAGHELGVAGHAVRAGGAGHPTRQPV